MKLFTLLSAPVAATLMLATSLHAQPAHDLALKARELRQEALKEKGCTPVPISQLLATEAATAEKTTANPDQKLTNVSSLATDEAEVHIAISPVDSTKMVLSFMQQTSTGGITFPIYFSNDGGQSWAKSSFNPLTSLNADFPGQLLAGGGDPTFAYSNDGKLYFSWIYLTLKQTFDTAFASMYWATSTDNGATFTLSAGLNHFIGQGAVDIVGNNLFDYKEGFFDRQWLAVDNSTGPNQGILYASFLLEPGDGNLNRVGTSVRKKLPGAPGFSTPITTVYNGTSQFSNIEVDKNGKVLVSFADEDLDLLFEATSTDGGNSFTVTQVATGNRFAGSQSTPPTDQVHDRENAAPNMTVDGAGRVHLVWTSFPTATGAEAYYAVSANSGASWSTPLNLNTWFPGKHAFMPTVAASGNKVTISVSVISANDSSRYYMITSTDGGQTFGTPVMVSSAASNYKSFVNSGTHFFGDYNRSVRTACNVYAAWSEARPGEGLKVYVAKVNQCATGVREITGVTGNLQLEALYPNPAARQVTVRLHAARSGSFTAILTDMTGRSVWQGTYALRSGGQEVSLPFGGQAAGTYMLTLRDNDGSLITRPLVVK